MDLPSFMPSWYRWEPENKDAWEPASTYAWEIVGNLVLEDPLACSELLVASTPIDDEFVARPAASTSVERKVVASDRLGSPFQCAAERAEA